MRQLVLTSSILEQIKSEYKQQVMDCKCRDGKLYELVKREINDYLNRIRSVRRVEVEMVLARNSSIWLVRKKKKYELYLDLLKKRLPQLLCATPTEFENTIVPDFERLIPRSEINSRISFDGVVEKESFSMRILKILRYQKVREMIAPKFFRQFGIKTCVYCNANYALTDANGRGYYDIDHWKPKVLYPYLCLSFFNFQPSCPSCNRRKGDSDGLYYCLWNDDPGADLDVLDFKLSSLSTIKYLVFGDETALDISLVPSHPNDIKNRVLKNTAEKKFHINDRYKEHNDVAEEIIWKKWIYSPSFMLSLRNALGRMTPYYVNAGRSILGTYTDPQDVLKRPLTRMMQAVAKNVGF